MVSITIKMKGEHGIETRSIDATLCQANEKLAIHRTAGTDTRDVYTLTHVPTGFRLCGHDDFARLLDMAHLIADVDWNFDDATFERDKAQIRERLAPIRKMFDASGMAPSA